MLRNLLISFFLLTAQSLHADDSKEHWAIYYGSELKAEKFQTFDVIVFDSDAHPLLASLKAENKILLGYLSLGEAEDYRSYYQTLAKKDLLLQANPNWKGHRVIDIRKPEWGAYVNDVLIPAILAQGFDGVMLDTTDSIIDLENADPKKYAGMKDAAVVLIKLIRTRYPTIKIMLNRGFDILPNVANDINMVMAESIYSDWQPGKKKPGFQSEKDYNNYVSILQNAQKQSPSLKIYTIDYWPPTDKKGIRHIYAMQRQAGFIPYVSTLNLQSVYREP